MLARYAPALALLAALAPAPLASGRGDWPPLPEGTRTVILATGSDFGYYRPKGCHPENGGSQYRPALDGWLARTVPDVTRIWVSTGNFSSYGDDPTTLPPGEMLAALGRIGYAVVGLGEAELRNGGVARFAAPPLRDAAPLLSANLVVHETGRPAFAGSRVLESSGRSVAFVAASPHMPDAASGHPAVGTVLTTPPLPAVRDEVRRVRPSVDLVVLVAAFDDLRLREVLAGLDGVDAVIASAGSPLSSEPKTIGSVPVLSLGGEGRLLGRLAIGADGRILEARTIWVSPGFPVDPVTGFVVDTSGPQRVEPAP